MVSYREFGKETSGKEVAERFTGEIRGSIVLITGVSPNSLGAHLAITLAQHTPSLLLLLASRTLSNLHAVSASLTSLYPSLRVKCIVVDFSSLESVRKAAEEVHQILRREEREGRSGEIDVLFNNAGINVSEKKVSKEGFELQFATNHLGPFLFTNLLLPLFLFQGEGGKKKKKKKKRIINTTSEAHRISPIRFSDINQEPGRLWDVPRGEQPRRGLPEGVLRADGRYEGGVAYGMSKTANVLFAVGINGRFAGVDEERKSDGVMVESFGAMPGTIMTNLPRGLDEEAKRGLMKVEEWKTHDQGVATLIVAGFDPKISPAMGAYLEDCQFRRPSKWASDPVAAERLWRVSEEMVGEKFGYNSGEGKDKETGKGSKL